MKSKFNMIKRSALVWLRDEIASDSNTLYHDFQ